MTLPERTVGKAGTRVLVVEDDAAARTGLTELLRAWGYETTGAVDGEDALAKVKADQPDIVLADLVMPRRDGLSLLRQLKDRLDELSFVMITAQGTVDSAVSAMKEGAYDYLTKPIDPQRLRLLLERVVERHDSRREMAALRRQLVDGARFGRMIGASPAILEVYKMVEQAAPSEATVLIWGESGTGKELMARTIHDLSPRAAAPFVALNCAAIPDGLLESEIFGHERGAYTGAVERRHGCFELAYKGTVLLDEVAEMAPALQAKLLRVLQERTIRRLGGAREHPIDVRIVAATNLDPKEAVNDGRLREDLYYRINVMTIAMPPLRKRREDIPLLIQAFLMEFNQRDRREVKGVEAATLDALKRYSWPDLDAAPKEYRDLVRALRRMCTDGRPRSERLRRRVLVLSTVVIVAVGSGAAFHSEVMARLPETDAIGALGSMANATVVYDAFDEPVFTLFRERRLSVPLSRVSPDLIRAVIAIEDRRFYRHRGIDFIRIGGAVLADLRTGRLAQGGSTITQQLARTSLLSRERTFRRKLAEVITAVRIERAYAKNDILELYLNKVYFGDGFHGVEAAARGYFGKHASDVNLAEAALLAGLIQAPGRYSPTRHPTRALARRNLVLTVMRETEIADAEKAQDAARQPLQLENRFEAPPEFGAYFKAEVQRQLFEEYGEGQVYGEGLRVYTTLIPDLQRAAEAAVHQGLHRIETLPRYPHGEAEDTHSRIEPDGRVDRLQAALIALEPQTGAVRAVVGGRRFDESPFNRATQAQRQPGSAFKPFLVAAALETGITPVTRLTELGRPTPTMQGDRLPDDGESDVSELMLRTALRVSSNRAAVRLLVSRAEQN